jgi:iron complex outermembrane receptor protein
VFSLAFGLPAELSAQQKGKFQGTVISAEDGNPMVGANLILRKDFSTGTVTDPDGRFSISLNPGYYTFILSFVGMESDTIPIQLHPGEVIDKRIVMKPLWNELEEVNVRVSKFDKRVEDITVSMEVLKPRLIESKNTRSIETVLDYTPGLNIMDNEPQIRGGSGFTFGVGSKVAVLIDDMPMISGDAGRPSGTLYR